MKCACGATCELTNGRGRPRKRCPACAADKPAIMRAWRAANGDEHNAQRRAAYAADQVVINARRRLAYAVRVGRRVAQAKRDLDKALKATAVGRVVHRELVAELGMS